MDSLVYHYCCCSNSYYPVARLHAPSALVSLSVFIAFIIITFIVIIILKLLAFFHPFFLLLFFYYFLLFFLSFFKILKSINVHNESISVTKHFYSIICYYFKFLACLHNQDDSIYSIIQSFLNIANFS